MDWKSHHSESAAHGPHFTIFVDWKSHHSESSAHGPHFTILWVWKSHHSESAAHGPHFTILWVGSHTIVSLLHMDHTLPYCGLEVTP